MKIIIAMLQKDMRILLKQRQVLVAMAIVPLLMSVILPAMFTFMFIQNPASLDLSEAMMEQLGLLDGSGSALTYMIDNVLLGFLLMIPMMSGSILAASSFVTEREHKTLESLFYTPLTTHQLLVAKLITSLIPALAISWISCILTALAINIPAYLMLGITPYPTSASWIVIFWLMPIIASFGLSFSTLVSAKSRTIQEAQQKSSMLVMPFILIITGSIAGIVTLDAPLLLGVGAVLLLVEFIILWLISKSFTIENLVQ